jgi:molecular chaperone DnaK
MEEFIHRENLIIFKRRLAEAKHDAQRQMLLSEADIDRMVKDAEAHSADDKKRRAIVEAKNHGEAFLHTTEKTVAEHGSKVSDAIRRTIENAMADLREALKGSDVAAITAKTNALQQASTKLGEAIYAQSRNASGAAGPGAGSGNENNENIVDAEFTEVEDDRNTKKSA